MSITDTTMTQAEAIRYFEGKRVKDGLPPGTVYAFRPFDTTHPGRAVVVVFEVYNCLVGDTVYAPKDIDWKSRRPAGVLYQA